jgi:hypothetical protein
MVRNDCLPMLGALWADAELGCEDRASIYLRDINQTAAQSGDGECGSDNEQREDFGHWWHWRMVLVKFYARTVQVQ